MKITEKPQTPKRTGRPESEAIRWNFQMAERETGVMRDTFVKRARALGITPGDDGCYSTREICAMMFGDKEAEMTGKLAEERRKLSRENDMAEGKLIETTLAKKLGGIFLVPVRQKILTSSLPDEEKDEILSDLVGFGEIDFEREAQEAYNQ